MAVKSRATHRARRSLGLTALLVLAALLYTLVSEWFGLDRLISGYFYHSNGAAGGYWGGARSNWVALIYHSVAYLVVVLMLGALAALAWGWRVGSSKQVELGALLVIFSLVFGAGLIVNSLLKDHWGRPRPKQVLEFGGERPYQPPLYPSTVGGHAFPSGHVAAAFGLLALWRLLPLCSRWRWPVLSVVLVYGLAVGYARLSAGGHFVTDVLWAMVIMVMVVNGLYFGVFRLHQIPNNARTQRSPWRFRVALFFLVLVLLSVVFAEF